MPELTPEERERIYLEEKERMEARERLQREDEFKQKEIEAKQRAYASLPPWKRPPDFETFNKDGLYKGSAPHKTKPLERPVGAMNMTGLQSCGLILAVSVVGSAVLLSISPPSSSSHDSGSPPSIVSSSAPVGSDVMLSAASGGKAGFFVDSAAYEEAQKFIVANDDKGLQELAIEGKILFTSNGTKAKVLSRDFLGEKVEVHILSGELEGRTGYVTGKQVH